MDQVAMKCYLGLALQEVIVQLGHQNIGKKLKDTFVESFNKFYTDLKNSYSQNSKVQGKIAQHFQYPIGLDQKLQYYLALGEMHFQVPTIRNIINKHSDHHHGNKLVPTILEGFSTNQGGKGKTTKRSKKNSNIKHQGELPRKKRTS